MHSSPLLPWQLSFVAKGPISCTHFHRTTCCIESYGSIGLFISLWNSCRRLEMWGIKYPRNRRRPILPWLPILDDPSFVGNLKLLSSQLPATRYSSSWGMGRRDDWQSSYFSIAFQAYNSFDLTHLLNLPTKSINGEMQIRPMLERYIH